MLTFLIMFSVCIFAGLLVGMARIEGPTFTGWNLRPVWAADYLSREHVIPGGAHLNEADFAANADGKKRVAAGTIVGRTFAERDAGTGFGPVAFTAGASVDDDEVYVTLLDVDDAAINADVELYRHNSLIKENFFPGFDALDSALQGWLRANYQTTIGAD